jgi:iron(III) transport system permease protein
VSLRAIGRAKRRNPIPGVGTASVLPPELPDAPDTRAVAAQELRDERELTRS